MSVITCPECGAILDSDKVSFEAHCMSHWGVPYRDIYKIANTEARRRYEQIMNSQKQTDIVVSTKSTDKGNLKPSDITGGL